MKALRETSTTRPAPAETPSEIEQISGPDEGASGFRVILYNDDWHPMDEVVEQVKKATQYDIERVVTIVLEAHHSGRAVCFKGGREKCQQVARVLREIRLQCEVDCD